MTPTPTSRRLAQLAARKLHDQAEAIAANVIERPAVAEVYVNRAARTILSIRRTLRPVQQATPSRQLPLFSKETP